MRDLRIEIGLLIVQKLELADTVGAHFIPDNAEVLAGGVLGAEATRRRKRDIGQSRCNGDADLRGRGVHIRFGATDVRTLTHDFRSRVSGRPPGKLSDVTQKVSGNSSAA